MLKKTKTILLSFLIGVTSTIAIGISTSCSNNFATVTNVKTTTIEYNASNTLLQSKTILDWSNDFTNKNFNEFISIINAIDNQYKNSNFLIDNNTTCSIEQSNTNPDDLLHVNAIIKFYNYDHVLIVIVNNLYITPPSNLVGPNLNLVKNPIVINQVDLPVIYNKNPQTILASEWTYYINQLSPANEQYIPNDLYYLKSSSTIGNGVFKLVYSINNQYSSIIDPTLFPDIIFHINISPNIDKIPNETYILDSNEVSNLFPNVLYENFSTLTEIEIYNKLVQYVDGLGIYEQIVNCVDENNPSSVYHFQITYQDILKQISITFTSNPKNSNSKIYFYNFLLKFE